MNKWSDGMFQLTLQEGVPPAMQSIAVSVKPQAASCASLLPYRQSPCLTALTPINA